MTRLPLPVGASVPVVDATAKPTAPSAAAEGFYVEALHELVAIGMPFLVAGSYAVSAYTGVVRPTKDLDIFTTAGDFPRILARLKEHGYSIEIEDERWIGKAY